MNYLSKNTDYIDIAMQIENETSQRIEKTIDQISQQTDITDDKILRTLALPITKNNLENVKFQTILKQKELKYHKNISLKHTLKVFASTFLAGMSGLTLPFIINDFMNGDIKSGILKIALGISGLILSYGQKKDYTNDLPMIDANINCMLEVEKDLSDLENKKLDLQEEISMLEHN